MTRLTITVTTALVVLASAAPSFAGDITFDRLDIRPSGGEVVIDDLNRDGTEDLAVATGYSHGGGKVGVLVQERYGQFERSSFTLPAGGPNDIAAGDLNSDGRRDLVVSGLRQYPRNVDSLRGDGFLAIATQTANGEFERSDIPIDGAPEGAAVGDIDGDGLTDIAVSVSTVEGSYGTGFEYVSEVVLLLQRPGGRFERNEISIERGGGDSVAIADVVRDGRADLVLDGLLLRQTSNRDFQEIPLDAGGSGDVAVADFNGDKRLDIAFGDEFGATCYRGESCPSITVLFQQPDGSFDALELSGRENLAAGDLDGDGMADLVTPREIFRSNGAAGFDRLAIPSSVFYSGLPVALGDLDQDVRLDVAVGTGGGVSLLRNRGDKQVPSCDGRQATIIQSSAWPASNLALKELKGTGVDDVIVGTSRPDAINGSYGADTICGRDGEDELTDLNDSTNNPSAARDRLLGGQGADILDGGFGDDRLAGGSGRDRLFGRDGKDDLRGGKGFDRCEGGGDKDSVRGCEGK